MHKCVCFAFCSHLSNAWLDAPICCFCGQSSSANSSFPQAFWTQILSQIDNRAALCCKWFFEAQQVLGLCRQEGHDQTQTDPWCGGEIWRFVGCQIWKNTLNASFKSSWSWPPCLHCTSLQLLFCADNGRDLIWWIWMNEKWMKTSSMPLPQIPGENEFSWSNKNERFQWWKIQEHSCVCHSWIVEVVHCCICWGTFSWVPCTKKNILLFWLLRVSSCARHGCIAVVRIRERILQTAWTRGMNNISLCLWVHMHFWASNQWQTC